MFCFFPSKVSKYNHIKGLNGLLRIATAKKKKNKQKLKVAFQYFVVGDPKFIFLFRKKSYSEETQNICLTLVFSLLKEKAVLHFMYVVN